MQNQNIRPIPNDDEWPLATVFDVTAKLALHHHNDDIFISRRQTSRFNTDECSQTTNSQVARPQPQHISRTALIPTVHIKTIITCNV